MLAAFKLRAVPINVNYRYVEDELRYLLDDADARAVVFHREFAPKLAAIRDVAPEAAHVPRGRRRHRRRRAPSTRRSSTTSRARGREPRARDFGPRSADDLYILYTGGTTGMPKGVMWRHEDVFFGAMGGAGGGGKPITAPEEIAERCLEPRTRCVPACPFMHGTAHWMAFSALFTRRHGGDPGRAPLRPARALGARRARAGELHRDRRRRVRPPDARRARHRRRAARSTCRACACCSRAARSSRPRSSASSSSGCPACSSSTATARRRPAARASRSWCRAATSRPRRGSASPTTRSVLGDDLRPAPRRASSAGSRAAGRIPLGYYKDPEKTAATFPVVDGVRWAVPGDHAVVEADGSITLLGRGSVSINTGGEKVYPEEVESVLKAPRRRDRRGRRRRPRRTLGRARRRGRAGRDPAPTRRSRRCRSTPRAHLARLQGPARGRARRRDHALAVGQARLPLGQGRPRSHAEYGPNAATDDQPPRRRDQPVPPPARATTRSTGMPWGDEAFARATHGAQADLPVGRLLVVPLVSRDGARVVRGRRRPPT